MTSLFSLYFILFHSCHTVATLTGLLHGRKGSRWPCHLHIPASRSEEQKPGANPLHPFSFRISWQKLSRKGTTTKTVLEISQSRDKQMMSLCQHGQPRITASLIMSVYKKLQFLPMRKLENSRLLNFIHLPETATFSNDFNAFSLLFFSLCRK